MFVWKCDFVTCAAVYIYVYKYVIPKLAVVGFSPHAYNAGVFAKNMLNHTWSNVLVH